MFLLANLLKVVIVFFAVQASANSELKVSGSIGIDSMVSFIGKANEGGKSEKVINKGDGVAFVKVEVLEVLGRDKKGQEITKDIEGVDSGFVVTPRKLIIPPNSSRSVRYFLDKEMQREKDRVFRVRFLPVAPTKEEGFFVGNVDYETALGITAGWGQLVFLSKNNAFYNTEFKRSDNGVLVSNKGDSYIRLDEMKVCDKKESCKLSSEVIVRPGESRVIFSRQEGGEFLLIEGDNRVKKAFYQNLKI